MALVSPDLKCRASLEGSHLSLERLITNARLSFLIFTAKFSFLCKPKVNISCQSCAATESILSASSLTSAGTLSSACLWQRVEAMPGSVTVFIHPTAALPANSSSSKRAAQAHGLRMQESPCPPRVLAMTSALTH